MKDYKMLEQVKDATTPDEMRAELFRLKHYDPLVRAVWDSADYGGMNAEDRYTVMAYHAVKAKTEAQQHVLEFSSYLMRPMIVPSNTRISEPCKVEMEGGQRDIRAP